MLTLAERKELEDIVKAKLAKTIHKVKIINKKPFIASIPSEMTIECDTWKIEPYQKTCKKGHIIEYVEEKK